MWRGLLVVAVLALSSCVSDIDINALRDGQPLTAATVEPSEHQLRVVAVDFDPPLNDIQVAPNGGVTLMVAVENQGQHAEANVRVSARLIDPSAAPEALDILDETVVLTELAAGQMRVVRFSPASGFPLLERYRLEVSLEPAAGEADTDDNFKTYEIVVPGSE